MATRDRSWGDAESAGVDSGPISVAKGSINQARERPSNGSGLQAPRVTHLLEANSQFRESRSYAHQRRFLISCLT